MDEIKLIFKNALALFLLMDPLGNVPLFISLLRKIDPQRQKVIIFREMCIALLVIILFYFIGDFLLWLLGVKEDAVRMAGGIILFLIAIKMIFPSHEEEAEKQDLSKEPFIVPLAIPLVAGPAILAAVMIYSKQQGTFVSIFTIVLAWIASTLILLSSLFIRKLLGSRGISACERLMGLILTLISIQMFLDGITCFVKS